MNEQTGLETSIYSILGVKNRDVISDVTVSCTKTNLIQLEPYSTKVDILGIDILGS